MQAFRAKASETRTTLRMTMVLSDVLAQSAHRAFLLANCEF